MLEAKDRFWLWGHEAGAHNAYEKLGGTSRMTPMEAACYMGIDNVVMVMFSGESKPPFDQLALSMSPLKRLVWSIVGAGCNANLYIDEVTRMSQKFPNINGGIMDDFFSVKYVPGACARYSVDQVRDFKSKLGTLDLWTVLYDYQLDFPISDYLEYTDVVNFWTWRSKDLANLEKNWEKLIVAAPGKRIVMGCYMWDYGDHRNIDIPLMRRQCEFYLDLLKSRKIEGIVFLATCICDLGLESVEWTRQWIHDVGKAPLAK